MIEFLQNSHKSQDFWVFALWWFSLSACTLSLQVNTCLLSKFCLFPGLRMRIFFMFPFNIMQFTYIKVSCWFRFLFLFHDQMVALKKIPSVLVTPDFNSRCHLLSSIESYFWILNLAFSLSSFLLWSLSSYFVAP